jgi:hypothetical protein
VPIKYTWLKPLSGESRERQTWDIFVAFQMPLAKIAAKNFFVVVDWH